MVVVASRNNAVHYKIFLAHAFCVLQSGNIGAMVETSKNRPAMVGNSNQGRTTLSRHVRTAWVFINSKLLLDCAIRVAHSSRNTTGDQLCTYDLISHYSVRRCKDRFSIKTKNKTALTYRDRAVFVYSETLEATSGKTQRRLHDHSFGFPWHVAIRAALLVYETIQPQGLYTYTYIECTTATAVVVLIL